MADGKYSVSSTYDCQFIGSIIQFPATSIWQAASKPKCRFFAWLVMHDRVPTANNLLKKNWPCNFFCSFCLCIHETTESCLEEGGGRGRVNQT
jgi:hypothetical protein